MIQVPITNVPNQSLSINLDMSQYDIRIHATDDNGEPGTEIMAVDITRDSVPIVTGTRAVPGYPIISSAYLENGNFIFVTLADDYPDWNQFGITQFLIFASQAELDLLQAPV